MSKAGGSASKRGDRLGVHRVMRVAGGRLDISGRAPAAARVTLGLSVPRSYDRDGIVVRATRADSAGTFERRIRSKRLAR